MSTKRIPIRVARQIAQERGQDQVIIVTYDRRRALTHVVTYGETLQDAADASQLGNRIKSALLGWPAGDCTAVPARLKRRLKDREEIVTIRLAIANTMWSGIICRHCGCQASDDPLKNPHAPDCRGAQALAILDALCGKQISVK